MQAVHPSGVMFTAVNLILMSYLSKEQYSFKHVVYTSENPFDDFNSKLYSCQLYHVYVYTHDCIVVTA